MGHTMRYLATDCATRESVRKPSYVGNLQFVKGSPVDCYSTTVKIHLPQTISEVNHVVPNSHHEIIKIIFLNKTEISEYLNQYPRSVYYVSCNLIIRPSIFFSGKINVLLNL